MVRPVFGSLLLSLSELGLILTPSFFNHHQWFLSTFTHTSGSNHAYWLPFSQRPLILWVPFTPIGDPFHLVLSHFGSLSLLLVTLFTLLSHTLGSYRYYWCPFSPCSLTLWAPIATIDALSYPALSYFGLLTRFPVRTCLEFELLTRTHIQT